MGEAFDCVCVCTDAGCVHGANGAGGGEHTTLSAPAACGRAAQPAGAGEVDGESRQSADRAGDGEPDVERDCSAPGWLRRRRTSASWDSDRRIPKLLDWLAVEFRESGWNMKHMYKLMVMSAAYRQSAKSTPEQVAKDPKNLLLSHGPRFRMDAEMLRDIALESSGLLVNEDWRP